MTCRLFMLLWLALFASVAYAQSIRTYSRTLTNVCPNSVCNARSWYCSYQSGSDGYLRAQLTTCSSPTESNVIYSDAIYVGRCFSGSVKTFWSLDLEGEKQYPFQGDYHESYHGSKVCDVTPCGSSYNMNMTECTMTVTCIWEVNGESCPPSDEPYCTFNGSNYESLNNKYRSECESSGGVYSNPGYSPSSGIECVSATCNDQCNKSLENFWNNEWPEIVDDCCRAGAGTEPISPDNFGRCVHTGNPNSPGIHYPYFIGNENLTTTCTESPAGSGSNYCNVETPPDTTAIDTIPKPPNDTTPEPCEGDDCDGSSADSGGGSAGSGCEGESCDGSSADSGGGGTSTDSGGGGSADSGCAENCDDPPPVYFCDRPENVNSDFCKNAGYDEHCENNPSDPYCEWSRKCSQNPSDPACVNPQPPPGGGFTPPPGGGEGEGGDSSHIAGVSCKDLKNCDWSTYEEQLKQKKISQDILDIIKELFPWMQRKSHEDSLLAVLRWLDEKDDRKKMIELSETINGRIFTYTQMADSSLKIQNRMDSMNGIYYYGNLSAASANAQAIKGAIDSLNNALAATFGNSDLFPHICRLNPNLVECGGSGNSGGGAYVEVDMSGVAEGLAGLGDGIVSVGEGVGESNRLLGRIDSILSSGNGDLIGALDSLLNSGGSCDGDECGNYDGVGDDAFSGFDTSGRGKAYYDSLLTSPGSVGLRDSVQHFTDKVRASTLTPFADNIACPEAELSVDFCSYFGGGCNFSFCDKRFYVQGKHILEWFGVVMEFLAWVSFFLRV